MVILLRGRISLLIAIITAGASAADSEYEWNTFCDLCQRVRRRNGIKCHIIRVGGLLAICLNLCRNKSMKHSRGGSERGFGSCR